MSRTKVYGALLLVQLFFATLPIALKLLFAELSSPSIALLRVVGAAALFVAMQRLLSGERLRGWRDHAAIALFAVFGVVLNQLLYITAVRYTTAAAAQTMMAVGPAITLLIAILARRESASAGKWAGIALAGCGAVALVGVGLHTGGAFGNLLALTNVTSYSVYLVISRDMVRRYQPLTVITWVFVYGALGILPWGIAPLAEEFTALSPRGWALIGYIILFPTVGAYYLNLYGLRHVDSSVVGSFIYLQPVLTALLAHAALAEEVPTRMVPAALLIFAGVFVTARAERASRRPRGPDDAPFHAAPGAG